MNDIHRLRKENWKIKVHHFRYVGNNLLPRNQISGNSISPFGGLTKMKITLPTGTTYVSEAKCSKSDVFNHKIANEICLGRIFKQIKNYLVDESVGNEKICEDLFGVNIK